MKGKTKRSLQPGGNAFIPILLHLWVFTVWFLQEGSFDTVCGRSGCQGGCLCQLYSGKQVFWTHIRELGQEAAGFSSSLKEIQENLSLIDDAAQKLASGQGTVDDTVGMGNAGKDIYDNIEGYVSSPKEFINGVLSSVKIQSWDALSLLYGWDSGKILRASAACCLGNHRYGCISGKPWSFKSSDMITAPGAGKAPVRWKL